MKTFSILISTLLLCGSAQARLGESPDEIQKRYGKPQRQGDRLDKDSGLPQSDYIFKDYSITVVFKEGKCVREWVNKKDYGLITDEEVFKLIKGITGEADMKNRGRNSWEGKGWEAIGGGMVVVTATAYQDQVKIHQIAEAKRKEAEAKRKAEGF